METVCSIDYDIVKRSTDRNEADMSHVTLSSKYQVVIPEPIRRSLRLAPGTKFQVIAYGGRIEFVPVRPMKEVRGFLKGIDTSVPRERDRL
jgi:AbrB family looped-hinge helix DNA binding protein